MARLTRRPALPPTPRDCPVRHRSTNCWPGSPVTMMVAGGSITRGGKPHVSFRCSGTSLGLAFRLVGVERQILKMPGMPDAAILACDSHSQAAAEARDFTLLPGASGRGALRHQTAQRGRQTTPPCGAAARARPLAAAGGVVPPQLGNGGCSTSLHHRFKFELSQPSPAPTRARRCLARNDAALRLRGTDRRKPPDE